MSADEAFIGWQHAFGREPISEVGGPGAERASEPQLTSEQEQAIGRRRGSLLLAAGAGSGKTTVLVERYVRACVEDGVRPSEILAITFTERAAWELKERVRARMVALRRRDLARDVEGASIGTFHGFCASVLRLDPLAAGLSPGFEVLDEGLAGRLRLTAFSEALRGAIAAHGQAAIDLAAAYNVDRLRRMVLSIDGELRSAGQLHPRLPELGGGADEQDAIAVLALLDDLLRRFGDAYERGKRARSALDFDDLELRALALLTERDEIRERWTDRLRLLMVDELQDTNRRQLALLATLERDNLFTVGDEWQSIYGFRNADVAIFRERDAELAERGASLALTRNFRSVASVIEGVNGVFCERFGDGYRRLEAARESADATSLLPRERGTTDPLRDEQPAVELLICDRDGWGLEEGLDARLSDGLPLAPVWRLAEARLLARRVAGIVATGLASPGEIAVLMRATGDLPVYERALAAERLPTLATAGSFWNGLEVGDLLAYLRVATNPLDEVALYGVLASPLVGMSLDSLALIAAAAAAAEPRLRPWEAIRDDALPVLDEGERERLAAFRARLLETRRRLGDTSISELLREAMRGAGYEQLIELRASSVAESQQRLANVRKLVRLAADFERSEGRNLRGFLDHVEHLRTSGGAAEPEAPAGDGDLDAIRLMSVHAAKGLEFKVVCVADLGRTPNRSDVPDLIVDGDRVGLRLIRLDDPTPVLALQFEQLLAERRRAAAEEEDRIIYVAMTRARDRLLLSGSASFARWPDPTPGGPPIAWLAPALVDDLAERLALELAGATGSGGPSADAAVACLLATPSSLLKRLGEERDLGSGGDLPLEAGTRGDARDSDRRDIAGSVPAAAFDDAADERRREPLERGSLSYTVLAELERCGYRHYLERVLLLPEAAPFGEPRRDLRGRGMNARARGEVAHRLLETIDFARGQRPPLARIVEVARELAFEPSEAEGAQVAELLDGLLSTPLAARIAAASALRREAPFAFSIGAEAPTVTGTFDLIATERDGRCLVVDYKSGSVRPDEDLERLVADRYGAQRLIYALAALRGGAREVDVVHCFLQRPEALVHARYDAAAAVPLEAQLRERVHAARERGYAVSERPHKALCLTCPGRSTRMCSWSEAEMLSERDERGTPPGLEEVSL